MRTFKPFIEAKGGRLADYTARMAETLVRRRAEIAVRAARVEAELSIKARSEFLANMNHELRTPLNAIIGFATMLRDSEEYGIGPDQRQNYSEYILQSADLLLGHINTILEVASLESGGIEVNDGALNASEILGEAIDRAKIRADAAGVEIIRRDGLADLSAWGDAARFSQSTDHLLNTAIKLSDEGGKIYVKVTKVDQGWIELAVRDEGDGFTKAELTEALDAFSHSNRGLDRSFSGPGVGYAVAKTFIELQGGRFSIESRKGQGTLAKISLPPVKAERSRVQETERRIEIKAEKKNDAA
ncbi:HAMP domain-containing sensor histidine kinase [Hyphococcus formosus]|uniref:sensor histidine kinase n=1 Tax=Hyphococcus formosus TaxID=3143534 RepID=UPI00398B60AA